MKRVILRAGIAAIAGIGLAQIAQAPLPTEPGMYVEAAGAMTKVIGQIVEFKRSGSALVSHVTAGIKSQKVNIQLLGPHAQTVVSPEPTFYFIPAKQEADAGVDAGDLILVRLEEKPARRQFEIAAHGLGRASAGISITHQVQLFRSEVSAKVYKVSPAVALRNGEYALYLSRGEHLAEYVYDFGVQEISPPALRVSKLPQPQPASTPVTSISESDSAPLTAADFSSKPRASSSPPQVFKDASIGVFCDGNRDVHRDGVTLTALTPGGAADQAGIRAGDAILSINDHYLFTIRQLQEEISHHEPGSVIKIRYRRYSSINETSIVVGRVQ